jgi:DNA polymerase III delta prime subunit
MNLSDVRMVAATSPPRMLIHGQEGSGKTTTAACFPDAVFLQTEDGSPASLIGAATDWLQVIERQP